MQYENDRNSSARLKKRDTQKNEKQNFINDLRRKYMQIALSAYMLHERKKGGK